MTSSPGEAGRPHTHTPNEGLDRTELSDALQDRRLSSSVGFETEPTNDVLKQVVADLQVSERAALEDRDLADREIRRLRRETDALRRELQEVREADPKSKVIREVLDYWRVTLHKTSRTKTPTGGERWNKVRSRLNEGFTVDDLKKAIDGCAALPFVGPHGRVATKAPGTQREDDIELICRSERHVERFQGYAAPPEEPEQEKPVWATEPDEAKAFVRYVYGDDCKLEPSTSAPAPRRTRDEFELPPVDKVIPALHAAGCDLRTNTGDSDRWWGKCPAHDDRSPSLQVWRKPDGRMGVKCWTGCSEDDILRAAHLEHADCWRGSEYDINAADYVPGRGPSLELQRTLRDIQVTLAGWEKAAA